MAPNHHITHFFPGGMHGCSLGDAPLVNVEVDSMGGVVDSVVGIELRPSPQQAVIENAQAELRREYDVREERRRELEFLEKGGNPLDFKFGNAASLSVQSTSLTDQPPELVTSEAKGSLALTASPHGDSVESSGKPEAPVVSEPNCADNLLLFDGGNDCVDGGRNSVRFVRSKKAPLEQTSQLDSSQNAKGSGESAAFGLPKSRAYKRRIRSRPNRDGGRSSSADIVPSRGGQVSSLFSHPDQKDVKGSTDSDNRQTPKTSLNHISKPTNLNGIIALTSLPSNGVVDMVLANEQAVESTIGPAEVGLLKLLPDCDKNLDDVQKSEGVGKEPSAVVSEFPKSVEGRQWVDSPCVDCQRSVLQKPGNQSGSIQQNGFRDTKGDEGKLPKEGQNCSATLTTKGLDSESHCSGTCLSLDRTSDSVPLNGLRSDDLISSVSPEMESGEKLKAKYENKADHKCTLVQGEHSSVFECRHSDDSLRPGEELHERGNDSKEESKCILSAEGLKVDGIAVSEIDKKLGNISTDDLDTAKENVCSSRLGGSVDKPGYDIPSSEKENVNNGHQDPPSVPGLLSQTALLSRDSSDTNKHKVSLDPQLKLDVRAHEDSILKEARIIEAKRKRIAQLSVGVFTSENHQKSHWDFLLEEMAWLANDFAQERLWKISAAAQLSHRVASTSRERLSEKSSFWKQKKVAHTLSNAIMEFWLSAEELSKGTSQYPLSNSVRGVQEYAVRYLKYNTSFVPLCVAEAPVTPERIYHLGSEELSREEQFTEENLFYILPPGAMETYRKAIESHLTQVERIGSIIQEEVETTMYDAAADHGSQGNAFEEDEGETNTYLLSGDVDSGKPSKFAQKKRILIKSTSARSYDMGTDPTFMQHMENKFGTQQSGLTVKRPTSNLHVSSIPTKRMRTASKPRFTSPYTAGTSGSIQVPNKTDGSSGDNNSFQDDQSTFLGGPQIPDNMEVESLADFERQLPFDSAEVSKPKKKKKAKHLWQGPTYEQRWHHGNNFQNDLGAYSRKRFDKLAECNGSSGLFGQPISKKQKMRQPMDNSLDNYSPLAGSTSSPVASQMSNMANSNKLVKILGGNRGKKTKLLKMPVGQTGPGSPWSSFEEQALIVLVHDLGPNWELISDAINNILQYKCIFRKPKECSEHHKELISRTAGDGADSAEDSGSSQPYPPTLPGIPKGSARALFQRLQEPIEEDMIKVHFEKIILMSQKQHYLKMQNENEEQKPIQPHSSHAVALSQVCPNNISGGPLLTPLDLCDTTAPSPDVLSSGYQGTHGGGLTISNQGGAASLHPTSGANSSLQGSPNMVHGNYLSYSSVPVNSSMRDGRYGVPRSSSLSVDEHQRVHQYNQMMPGRVPGTPQGTDRGVRVMAGGNGMGIMCGMNRNMNMTRPGFPGITPSVLNSDSMLPSNMTESTESANLHSGVGAGPGNSMLRPRDSLNMMRVPQHQRQMLVPDHQMQATQGNIQGAPPFEGISGGLSNQASPPSSQTHPFHQQQQHQSFPRQSHLQGANHASSPQHQAHAIRLAKERHLRLQQQRLLHQHMAASSGIMPRGPPQPQSSLQNSSHVQPPASASVALPLAPSPSSTPAKPHQQKPIMQPHGLTRNPQSGGNQMEKHRQRQNSHPQAGRHHPQQRPHPQQHAKLVKGAERGNIATNQNLSVDPSILNGLSPTTGSQSIEKPENTMQGQGLYHHHPSNKHLVQQQRSYSGKAIASSKQAQQLPSHMDNSSRGQTSPPTSCNTLPTSHQADSPSVTSSLNSQQFQPTQKLANQSLQPVQRVLQQNRQIISDSSSNKLLADHGQSEQLHVSGSSSPSQLSTTAVSHQPVEIVRVKPVVSSASGTRWKAPEQMQNSILPKPATPSAPVGNTLTSLSRTQSQGSGEGQTSVTITTQVQTSSLPSSQEQKALPLQHLQAENCNLQANVRSTDNRLE